jgi:hypothetical protein
MAISVVDTGSTAAAAQNGADVTLNLSSLQQDDIVVVMGGICSSAAGTPLATGNNSGAYQNLILNDTGSNIFYVAWQRMGATPDTSINCDGNGDTADTTAYACVALRGASTDTPPTDATTTIADGSSTNPDPPQIDWSTAGTAIIVGALSVVNDAGVVAPSGYATATTWNAAANDTNEDGSVAIAYDLTPGADPENPATFTTWNTGAWQAATVAIKEAAAAFIVVPWQPDPMPVPGLHTVQVIGV